MTLKLRSERGDLERDQVAHFTETKLNLGRFIKYKQQHYGS